MSTESTTPTLEDRMTALEQKLDALVEATKQTVGETASGFEERLEKLETAVGELHIAVHGKPIPDWIAHSNQRGAKKAPAEKVAAESEAGHIAAVHGEPGQADGGGTANEAQTQEAKAAK